MKVSVILSVHNGERFVRDAVLSILAQTYRDFELVIVDDASTDGTRGILEGMAARDGRVSLITNPTNLGLTRSLNVALRQAQGDYVARMDADDVALPTRLEKQIAFLDTHPDVGVVGTWYDLIDEAGRVLTIKRPPTDPNALQRTLPRYNPFLHSSVMMRRALLNEVGGYDETYHRAQDYDLWMRLATRTHLANLPEVLMQKRFTTSMISYAREREQIQFALRARREAIHRKQHPIWCFIFLVKPFLATILPTPIVRFVRAHIFNQQAYRRSLGSSRTRRSG